MSPAPIPATSAAAPDVANVWPEVLQAIEDLREFFRDYADLMQNTWSPENVTQENRTLVLFHQGLFQQRPTPVERMGRVVDLYRKLLDVINKDELSFRIPTRSALIPESENPELLGISRRIREFNAPVEQLIAQVRHLDAPAAPELGERFRSLFAGMACLFKGMLRQDWDDVDLVLNHINLVTTSSKSRGLVRQMAQMARDIYNSLNAFSAEYRVEELSQSAQEIPDAVEKLRSVIKRLEEYANANLDALEQLNRDLIEDKHLVDEALRVVEQCGAELEQLAAADSALGEILREINAGLARDVTAALRTLLDRVQENQQAYLALIANMSFQDLTGQTLKKVIAFIENLQFQLINMISRHQGEGAAPAKPEPEVPLEGPDTQGRLALSQENVDKMLADLGF
jgi:chemotaxis protein CheZ